MFLLLLLLWILLNGKLTLEILLIGLVLVWAISAFMYKHLGYVPSDRENVLRKTGWALLYLVVLCGEVIKSGLTVLKFVTARKVDIQPQIVLFRVPLKTELLKIVMANSITLTPGTVTLHIEDEWFYVHVFDYTLGEELPDNVMLRLLMKMEADMEKVEERKGGNYFE